MSETKTVATIVGENVRRLRADIGATGDALAQELHEFSSAWSSGRISELENGRVSPTAPTLFMLSQALTALLGRPVTVAELVTADTFVEVGEVGVQAQRFAEAFTGSVPDLRLGDFADGEQRVNRALDAFRESRRELASLPSTVDDVAAEALARAERHSGDAERKIAAALGRPVAHVIAAAAKLWGHSLTTERDRRAGPDANAQRRGIVTRQLKAEVAEVLDGDG